jgi:hypothetical protein
MCDLLYWFFTSNVMIGWATVVAELAVAAVIYAELGASRLQNFVERTTEPQANADRSDIYKAYLGLLKVSDFDEASKAFLKKLHEDACLKGKCDQQIAHFNALGIGIDQWLAQKDKIVEIFPHAAVMVWLILGPYIKQRREDSGSWFATPLLKFALASVRYVIRQNPRGSLRMRHPDGSFGLELTPANILQIKTDLEVALKP